MSIRDAQHIHIIGIGGIGISALARMLVAQGKTVSGVNDSESGETLDALRAEGVAIDILSAEASRTLPANADIFVYSVAWEERGPDVLAAARATGKPILSYFEALGELSKDFKTIAIAGTHGKTTTTAMTALALRGAGLSPTAIVGSLVDFAIEGSERSNFLKGSGEYFVVEACEYKRHFLHFSPHILVITNIELDHPDYYRDVRDVQDAFRTLAQQSEHIVCNPHDPNLTPVLEGLQANVVDASEYLPRVPVLAVPGAHNRENAAGVLAVSDILHADEHAVRSALTQFAGTWRRFEYKGKTKSGALVYDDYAHHPTEIKATLQAARVQYPDARIIAVFEPHTFSRTKALLHDFAQSFHDVDEVIVAPIYAAREHDDGTVSTQKVRDAIGTHHKKVAWAHTLDALPGMLTDAGENDVILFLGAGDVYHVAEKIVV